MNILENLDSLVLLGQNETMSATALKMGVTQSTISKRIQALEYVVGIKLVEPKGKKVILTTGALKLIEKCAPLLLNLKEEIQSLSKEKCKMSMKVGLSESILST